MKGLSISILLLWTLGCKNEDEPAPVMVNPYEIIVESFFVFQQGDPVFGGCGYIIYAEQKLGEDFTYFKPFDLTEELKSGLSRYEGKFLIYPQRFECTVSRPTTGSDHFDMQLAHVIWYSKL